jgi:DNA replication ATP-dependent helicase Dna2
VAGTQERRSILLQDDWSSMELKSGTLSYYHDSILLLMLRHTGDIINVIGEFVPLQESSSSLTSSITINLKSNLLILHPDILLTATALSNGPQCLRKPLLSSMVRASGDVTPALVWGNMLHTAMQSCLSSGKWDEQSINGYIDEVIQNGLSDLFQLNMTVSDAQRELKARANGIRTFAERYISPTPKVRNNEVYIE